MKRIKCFTMVACLAITIGGYSQVKPKNTSGKKPAQKPMGITKNNLPAGWQGCSAVQPQMMKRIDTTKPRGLADNYYLWEKGQTVVVKFLSGSPALKQKVANYAKEWEKYANIKFSFVESGAANIRVLLNDKDGYWSVIGTLANSREEDKHTLNLDTAGTNFKYEQLLRTTVIHEFGHALGFLHEHSSPNANIPWNKELLYVEYAKSQGWTKEQIDAQVFMTYKASYANGTKYDPKSVMHYPISAKETIGGYSQGWNLDLSEGDKELAQLLYPLFGDRSNEVPRFTVSEFTKLNIVPNAEKKGLDIYPSFNLKTRGQSAEVIFIAYFYDKDGNPLMDNDDKYNAGGQVATYKYGTIAPLKNIDFNKALPKDFGLFIPYSEFPLPNGANEVKTVFQVKLFYEKENESKILYSTGDFVNCKFVK